MQIVMPKESNNCRIREYIPTDIPLLAEIEFNTEVKRYVGIPDGTKEQWMNKAKDCLYGWAIEALPEEALAGRVNIHRAKDRPPGTGEIQIIIDKKFWGRKLGREVATIMLSAAFNELKANSVIAEVHPDNKASLKLLHDFGFRYESRSPKQPMLIYKLIKIENNVNQLINQK